MRMTAKFLLIYSIIALLGYSATAQDDPAKISDAVRATSKLNEVRLRNQESGDDTTVYNKLNADERLAVLRLYFEVQENKRLKNQALDGVAPAQDEPAKTRGFERIISELQEMKDRLRNQESGGDPEKIRETERFISERIESYRLKQQALGGDPAAQIKPTAEELREFNRRESERREKDILAQRASMQRLAARIKDPARDNIPLQYTIRMNRTGKYKLGEPVFIGRYVKNLSDIFLWFSTYPTRSPFSTDEISLMDADGNEVPMTRVGKQEYEFVKNGGKEDVSYTDSLSNFLVQHNVNQNHEKELQPVGGIVLNRYFDMSQPGIYYLTFHRLSFDTQNQLSEPLASNTLTIEVRNRSRVLKNSGSPTDLPLHFVS